MTFFLPQGMFFLAIAIQKSLRIKFVFIPLLTRLLELNGEALFFFKWIFFTKMVRIRYRRFQKSWTLRLGVDNARILWYNRLLWQESKSGFGIFCAHFGISAWTFGYWYRNDAYYPDSWNSFQGAHGEQLALLVGVVLSLKFHRLGLRFSIFVFFFLPFR